MGYPERFLTKDGPLGGVISKNNKNQILKSDQISDLKIWLDVQI